MDSARGGPSRSGRETPASGRQSPSTNRKKWGTAVGKVESLLQVSTALDLYAVQKQRRTLKETDPWVVVDKVRALCQRRAPRPHSVVQDLVVNAGFLCGFIREQPLEAQFRLCQVLQFEDVGRGKLVCRQGESGDRFYMIIHGCVSVQCLTSKRQVRNLGNLGRGDYFGDIALISGQPRQATCITRSDTCLLTVGKEDFLELYKNRFSVRCVQAINFLRKQVRPFLSVSEPNIRLFAHYLCLMCFNPGTTWNVDDEATLFFIRAGESELLIPIAREDPRFKIEGPYISVTRFKEGDYFGESSVFPEDRCGWIVRALTPMQLFAVRSKDFVKHADPVVVSTIRSESAFRVSYYAGRHNRPTPQLTERPSTRSLRLSDNQWRKSRRSEGPHPSDGLHEELLPSPKKETSVLLSSPKSRKAVEITECPSPNKPATSRCELQKGIGFSGGSTEANDERENEGRFCDTEAKLSSPKAQKTVRHRELEVVELEERRKSGKQAGPATVTGDLRASPRPNWSPRKSPLGLSEKQELLTERRERDKIGEENLKLDVDRGKEGESNRGNAHRFENEADPKTPSTDLGSREETQGDQDVAMATQESAENESTLPLMSSGTEVTAEREAQLTPSLSPTVKKDNRAAFVQLESNESLPRKDGESHVLKVEAKNADAHEVSELRTGALSALTERGARKSRRRERWRVRARSALSSVEGSLETARRIREQVLSPEPSPREAFEVRRARTQSEGRSKSSLGQRRLPLDGDSLVSKSGARIESETKGSAVQKADEEVASRTARAFLLLGKESVTLQTAGERKAEKASRLAQVYGPQRQTNDSSRLGKASVFSANTQKANGQQEILPAFSRQGKKPAELPGKSGGEGHVKRPESLPQLHQPPGSPGHAWGSLRALGRLTAPLVNDCPVLSPVDLSSLPTPSQIEQMELGPEENRSLSLVPLAMDALTLPWQAFTIPVKSSRRWEGLQREIARKEKAKAAKLRRRTGLTEQQLKQSELQAVAHLRTHAVDLVGGRELYS